ncbi:MAG: nitrite reductase small subunit NirD [Burkholderiaceae bacterium]|nr:nitrite reductase small subunit NirD [Burkholderiaceae bacterium]
MTRYRIGSLADIPLRGSRCVDTPAGRIAVFRTFDDQVFATENRCPHRGGPLADGIVHGHAVTCPLHNWTFSLETGRATGADDGAVAIFRIENRDGELILDLDAIVPEPAEASGD